MALSNLDRLLSWPGKSADTTTGIQHPALYHMIDVAAVAEHLVAPHAFSASFKSALVALVALHDLGKINDDFRAMIHNRKAQVARHWEVSEILLLQNRSSLSKRLGIPDSAVLTPLLQATAGHHGRPSNLTPNKEKLALARVGHDAQADRFRDLAAGGPNAPEDAGCTEWLAYNRRRALLADVAVGTIDQALLSVLPVKWQTLRHFGLSSKILIVDEVHELGEPYIDATLTQLLRMHRAAGGSAILLTATLPLAPRQRLMAVHDPAADRDPAYPALTLAGGAARRDLPKDTGARGPILVNGLESQDKAVALLVQAAGQGAACVWVRNAVDDAIAAGAALRALNVVADLLHARFALADRKRIEAAAMARFGKAGQGRGGRVLHVLSPDPALVPDGRRLAEPATAPRCGAAGCWWTRGRGCGRWPGPMCLMACRGGQVICRGCDRQRCRTLGPRHCRPQARQGGSRRSSGCRAGCPGEAIGRGAVRATAAVRNTAVTASLLVVRMAERAKRLGS